MTSATFGRFSILSMYSLERCRALRIAVTVLGFCRGEFFREGACLFGMVRPHLLCRDDGISDVRPYDGAQRSTALPRSKPSILSTFILATICGGGIVISVYVLVRMNPARPQPVAHPHGVSARREGHRERQWITRQPLALSTRGFISLAVFTVTLKFVGQCEMACPFRLINQGMIMGFTGENQASPMLEEKGMPSSICVA